MRFTAVHIRSRSLNIVSLSDMIEGSYRSWDLYTTGQLVDGLQQKRKLVFIKLKWNHVVFSRATILSFHPVVFEILSKNSVSLNISEISEAETLKLEKSIKNWQEFSENS